MENIKRKVYKEFQLIDTAERIEMEITGGKRPILYVSDFSFSPPTDVYESGDSVFVVMEIAGLSQQNLGISYRDGYLVIEGERKEPKTAKEIKVTKYHKKEIDYGPFLVKIKMNTRIDKEKIAADYKDGMLLVILPKNVSRMLAKNMEIPITIK
jgi:HSP20 family protein